VPRCELTFINAVAFLCGCNLSSFKSHRMLRPISSWPRPGRSEKYSRSAHDDKTVSLLCPQQLFKIHDYVVYRSADL
jgi:hypothetical protein